MPSPTQRKDTIPRSAMVAWAAYDWANNGFVTIVQTFIFAAYFTRRVAPDPETGTSYWGMAIGIAGLCVAIAGPVMGATADQAGRRKPWIAAFTSVCIVATAALWTVQPRPDDILLAAVLVGIATFGAEAAFIFYNSMLPHLVGKGQTGKWSGWGWGIGYTGGLVSLLIVLIVFIAPEEPPLGLSKENAEPVRASVLLVAAWYALFTLPLLVITPDVPPTGKPLRQAVRDGIRQIFDTVRRARQYGGLMRFLIARLVYTDGLATLFAFGGVYASGAFGMTERQVLYFGIAINVTAIAGAIVYAVIDRWAGSKSTILVALGGLILAGVPLLLVGSPVWKGLFGTSDASYDLGLVTLTRDELWFWGFGLIIGLFFGPLQAASRAFLSRLAPEELRAQFFGLYTLSGKGTAFLGPLLVGFISSLAGSQRWGMSIIVVYFALGLVLMLRAPQAE